MYKKDRILIFTRIRYFKLTNAIRSDKITIICVFDRPIYITMICYSLAYRSTTTLIFSVLLISGKKYPVKFGLVGESGQICFPNKSKYYLAAYL